MEIGIKKGGVIMAFRSANPALNKNTFRSFEAASAEPMTINGAVNKTAVMLILLLITAGYVWRGFFADVPPTEAMNVNVYILVGVIGGLIFALITVFKKTWAPFTAPIYALLEGLFLGGVSAFFEKVYPGIVIQAVALTFGVLLCLLAAYRSGIIKATENFKLGIVAATGSIFMIYMLTIVLGFFGISIPYIHGSGPIGIIFSLVVVVIAALNLVLDFDFIERGAEAGAPKYMEWYAAFGLMVTLIWLYIEILHLLAKLQSRR